MRRDLESNLPQLGKIVVIFNIEAQERCFFGIKCRYNIEG